MMQHVILLISLSIFSSMALAGINENLQNFYTRMGGSVNETPGGAYQGQSAGHYTLGGMSTRSNINALNLVSAQAPNLRGGCGGIDLYMGSFSFIKSQDLKRMLQAITTSGANYGFMMGFEQFCPMCKKTMDQLNKLAQEINQWNINNCTTTAALMGGVMPKTQAVQNYVCSTLGSGSGALSDYAASRQGCGAGGKSTEILAQARQKGSAFEDIVTDRGNLAWLILNKVSLFSSTEGGDRELNELMMTISGSFILNPQSKSQEWSLLPSRAGDKNLMDALMFGGAAHKAKIYRCNDVELYGCLLPTYTQEITIQEDKAFVGKVKRLLYSIKTKVRSKEELPLTSEELDLINRTKTVPLMKAINVQSAYSFAGEIINIENYAELIARDLLEDYLTELLDLVRAGSQKITVDDETLRQFMVGIREARDRMLYLNMRDTKNFNEALDLVQKIQVLEKMLAGEFSADMARTLDWAVGRR